MFLILNISTHSLTKRLTYLKLLADFSFRFQLTASRRGWPCEVRFVRVNIVFQLTASRRGWRHKPHACCLQRSVFQLTASRRGWLSTSSPSGVGLSFQLTASRRGWRKFHLPLRRHFSISTHSLTKRLTLMPSAHPLFPVISTHSLTKRLTAILDKNTFI